MAHNTHLQAKLSTLSEQGSMPTMTSATLRPQFYLVRPDPHPAIVPLIPYDELPPQFREIGLSSVPTTLTTQHIHEWDMSRVNDLVPFRGCYEISNSDAAQSKSRQFCNSRTRSPISLAQKQENGAAAREISSSEEHENQHTPSVSCASSPAKKIEHDDRKDPEVQMAMLKVADQNKWEKENDMSKTKGAMTAGVYGKKKYCTHWIRTGNCDYVQEGCRYEHVIPDRETLLSIGIRDLPRWHREELPSPPKEQAQPHVRPVPRAAVKNWRNPEKKGVPRIEQAASSRARQRQNSGKPSISGKKNAPVPVNRESPPKFEEQKVISDRPIVADKVAPSPILASTEPVVTAIAEARIAHDSQIPLTAGQRTVGIEPEAVAVRQQSAARSHDVAQSFHRYLTTDINQADVYGRSTSTISSSDPNNSSVYERSSHASQYRDRSTFEQDRQVMPATYRDLYGLSPYTSNEQSSTISNSPSIRHHVDLEIEGYHQPLAYYASPTAHLSTQQFLNQNLYQPQRVGHIQPADSARAGASLPLSSQAPAEGPSFGAVGQGRPMPPGFASVGHSTPASMSPPIYHKRRFIGPNEPTHSRAHEPEIPNKGRQHYEETHSYANGAQDREDIIPSRSATYEEAAAMLETSRVPQRSSHDRQDNLISLDSSQV